MTIGPESPEDVQTFSSRQDYFDRVEAIIQGYCE